MATTSYITYISVYMLYILIVLALGGVVRIFFVQTPDDTLVMFGDSTQLNCSYNENGNAAWYKGKPGEHQKAITLGDVIVDNNPNYEVIGGEDGLYYHIRIRNVDMANEDNYECGNRIVTWKRASAHLYVIKSGPACSVKPNYILTAGENVTLTCSIDLNKNAPSELVWFKNGIEIYRKEGQESTVTIQLDKSDHKATYDCGLQHFTLPSWKWSNLTCREKIVMAVKYTPSFGKTDETTFIVLLGNFINLVCTADGFPKPNITWFDSDGDVIPGNEVNRKINTQIDDETRVTSILNIYVVDESYYGVYKCQASNEVASIGNQTFNILEESQGSAFHGILKATTVTVAVPIFTVTIVWVC